MSPIFAEAARKSFDELLAWRRDVRTFKKDPIEPGALERLLEKANQAPSVGLSQPWRFVAVANPGLRAQVAENFEKCRLEAEAGIPGFRQGLYSRAKLEGLRDAPLHLAAFTDTETARGHGLGRFTVPESLEYSTVMAIHTLWLAARLEGLGLGWVSILDPGEIKRILQVPEAWKFTAYLCLGLPAADCPQPELEAIGWEKRQPMAELLHWRP